MAGLVGYASSDEEDEVLSQPAATDSHLNSTSASQVKNTTLENQTAPSSDAIEPKESVCGPTPASPDHIAPIGPSLPSSGDFDLPDADETMLADALADPGRPPQSPYSSKRSLIHDLTLPSVPDFDIPPSPPGSPPAALDKKFAQFLDLKKKGVHFNQKLEQSSALKNPNLMDKLMRFVEIDGVSQYETTLPKDLWDPTAFPQWAHREDLRKSRDQLVKERETHNASGARKTVDFVPASKGPR